MKKTMLLTHEFSPHRGGIARYCSQLFKYLPPEKYIVVTDQPDAAGDSTVIHTRLINRSLWPSWTTGVFTVLRLMREHSIEYCITPHVLPLGAIALCARLIRGTPYCISVHGLDIMTAHKRRRWLTKRIMNKASFIIANSQHTKKIVDGMGYRRPTYVINPALDPASLVANPALREKLLKTYAGKKIILTVGRLVRRKGHDMVLHALPHIISKIPNIFYIIVGDGPDRGYLESIITDLNLGKYVHILSNVPDADVGGYYSVADVFAMPTRAIGPDVEGFGIVFLEAAYAGLPIVAGVSGGEIEAIGSDARGLCINGENLGELTDALMTILTEPELASFMGSRARARVLSLPTWERQATTLKALLS